MSEAIKRIDKSTLPCKFASHFSDSVPVPFGSGYCSMPGFECIYDGEIIIPDDLICKEDSSCPAFQPVEVLVCPKHNQEYFDVCSECEAEYWK